MIRLFYLISILLLITSCYQNRKEYTYPQQLKDNWSISTPEQEGMDTEIIKRAIPKINGDYGNIDGIVVVRNGKLIVDEYFNGYDADKLHKVFSITKSIVGALVGIAIEQGHLESEEDSIKNYMGHYLKDKHPHLQNLTLKHLLTMTTGLDWVELGDRDSQGMQVPYTNDWIHYVLSQPLNSTPGNTFNYSSGNAMLLAPIIKNATRMQADKFAEEYLFSPLGITHYEWDKMSEFWTKTADGEIPGAKAPTSLDFDTLFLAFPSTGSGLKMRPRDMAKFGQLYLNGGQWEGRQIISKDWIKQSTQEHFGNKEYGYLWRLTEYDFKGEKIKCYYGTGFGLQKLCVFPTLDLVVVLTQQNYRRMPQGEKETQDIINNYILKAIR